MQEEEISCLILDSYLVNRKRGYVGYGSPFFTMVRHRDSYFDESKWLVGDNNARIDC